MFVSEKCNIYKCYTPIAVDFMKHRALLFIRGPGFIHLYLNGLEGKEILLCGHRQVALLVQYQQLALCSNSCFASSSCIVHCACSHHMMLLACFSCCMILK